MYLLSKARPIVKPATSQLHRRPSKMARYNWSTERVQNRSRGTSGVEISEATVMSPVEAKSRAALDQTRLGKNRAEVIGLLRHQLEGEGEGKPDQVEDHHREDDRAHRQAAALMLRPRGCGLDGGGAGVLRQGVHGASISTLARGRCARRRVS